MQKVHEGSKQLQLLPGSGLNHHTCKKSGPWLPSVISTPSLETEPQLYQKELHMITIVQSLLWARAQALLKKCINLLVSSWFWWIRGHAHWWPCLDDVLLHTDFSVIAYLDSGFGHFCIFTDYSQSPSCCTINSICTFFTMASNSGDKIFLKATLGEAFVEE